MARGRRSRAAKEWSEPPKLERDVFHRFVADVGTARSRLNDANMAHAGAWKKAEPMGIHAQAAKLFCRLDDMEDTKRKDFLRAFDLYRSWADWEAQIDMFESNVEQAQETAGGADEGDGDPADDDGDARDPAEPTAEREPLPETVEVEADHGEETAAEATEELAGAGFIFADGKQAAIGGAEVDANPHAEGTPSHSIWLRGHAQGLADKAAADAGEDDADVVPLRGRRSRRADTEAACAALH